MASQPTAASTTGVTRGKLILIAALAGVFVFVIYWNYFRDEAAAEDVVAAGGSAAVLPAEGKTTKRPTARTPATEKPGASDAPASHWGTQAWPKFDLEEVVGRDPFAVPGQFPQPAPPEPIAAAPQPTPEEQEAIRRQATRERQAASLAEIKQAGVQLVFRNGKEYVAKIGERQVRVGDEIPGTGFRVVDISLQGVTLEVLEGDSP